MVVLHLILATHKWCFWKYNSDYRVGTRTPVKVNINNENIYVWWFAHTCCRPTLPKWTMDLPRWQCTLFKSVEHMKKTQTLYHDSLNRVSQYYLKCVYSTQSSSWKEINWISKGVWFIIRVSCSLLNYFERLFVQVYHRKQVFELFNILASYNI